MTSSTTRGTLYLVATPIGNLEDINFRALRILKEVAVIACEDTRQTQKLLNHFSIATRTTSYHEHNEQEKAGELVAQLERGDSVAIVADAGMPGISDPGYRLVLMAVERKIPVVPIPGATAFVSALVASALPTDSFSFRGFLPQKSSQRRKLLETIKDSERTEIFYEAPHRIVGSLEDIVDVLGPARPVVVAREVTKIHEEFLRKSAADALDDLKGRAEVRGEITLLIGKAAEDAAPVIERKNARTRVRELMQQEGVDEREAMKRVAKEFGVSKSEIYRELQKGR